MSIEFWLTSLVIILVPGTGVIYTVSTALFLGQRSAVFAALGCTLGILPSLTASITGLALIIHTSALAFQTLKYAGVAYLLYLAWGMARNGGSAEFSDGCSAQSNWNVMWRGLLINILNPKLSVFFLAFLPQFIPHGLDHPTQQLLVHGFAFMGLTFVIFILYGAVAAYFRNLVTESPSATTVLRRLFAASFAGLALRLAFSTKD